MTFQPIVLAVALEALVAVNLALVALGLARYPAYFLQPGARTFVWETVGAFLVYAFAIVRIASVQSSYWRTILRSATIFGLTLGMFEIVNIGIENGIPFTVRGPILQIVFMLAVFISWGVAGFHSARSLRSIRAGILAAICSAAICMLIGVAAGFVLQFFLAPPRAEYISAWGEFTRSGWTDARAFGLANTLDSAFTHLVIAPIVALIFGGVASWAALAIFRNPLSRA
jgi:hypothetical protein